MRTAGRLYTATRCVANQDSVGAPEDMIFAEERCGITTGREIRVANFGEQTRRIGSKLEGYVFALKVWRGYRLWVIPCARQQAHGHALVPEWQLEAESRRRARCRHEPKPHRVTLQP